MNIYHSQIINKITHQLILEPYLIAIYLNQDHYCYYAMLLD